jgi:hypothetical protein
MLEPPVTVGTIEVIGTPNIPVVDEGDVVTSSGIRMLVAEAVSERPTELIALTRNTYVAPGESPVKEIGELEPVAVTVSVPLETT